MLKTFDLQNVVEKRKHINPKNSKENKKKKIKDKDEKPFLGEFLFLENFTVDVCIEIAEELATDTKIWIRDKSFLLYRLLKISEVKLLCRPYKSQSRALFQRHPYLCFSTCSIFR